VVSTLVFADGIALYPRPDVVPGVPLVLYGSQYPGRKAFNPASLYCAAHWSAGRLRAGCAARFWSRQADVAFQRHFKLTEKVGLVSGESSSTSSTTRTLAPTNSLTRPLFGQSAQTLASSLASTILFR
jgi:hypothetical protein